MDKQTACNIFSRASCVKIVSLFNVDKFCGEIMEWHRELPYSLFWGAYTEREREKIFLPIQELKLCSFPDILPLIDQTKGSLCKGNKISEKTGSFIQVYHLCYKKTGLTRTWSDLERECCGLELNRVLLDFPGRTLFIIIQCIQYLVNRFLALNLLLYFLSGNEN